MKRSAQLTTVEDALLTTAQCQESGGAYMYNSDRF